MRHFPRTASQRMLAVATAAILASGLASVPQASANDDLKHKQHQVQSQVKSRQHQLDESSGRLRRSMASLSAARRELRRARARLDRIAADLEVARRQNERLHRQLQAARERLDSAETAVADGHDALTTQQGEVADVVNHLYQEGDPQLQAFASMLQAKNTSDLTWSQEGQNVIVGNETRAYDELQAVQVMLKVRESNLADAEVEVADKKQAAAEQVARTKGLRDQARSARDDVRTTVAKRHSMAQKARAARAKDLRALKRSKAHEAKIKRRILAAARRSRGGYHGPSGGFLQRPVPGYVTSPFGWRMHPIYHYWGLHDGDDFHAPCGTPLRAAGTGTVFSEYYSSVWGNRLYLNLGNVNGKNVSVIYNHISRYAVGRGAHVSRGQVVAYAGTTGWSTACHLHFTVMVNGKAVNPMNWF